METGVDTVANPEPDSEPEPEPDPVAVPILIVHRVGCELGSGYKNAS